MRFWLLLCSFPWWGPVSGCLRWCKGLGSWQPNLEKERRSFSQPETILSEWRLSCLVQDNFIVLKREWRHSRNVRETGRCGQRGCRSWQASWDSASSSQSVCKAGFSFHLCNSSLEKHWTSPTFSGPQDPVGQIKACKGWLLPSSFSSTCSHILWVLCEITAFIFTVMKSHYEWSM